MTLEAVRVGHAVATVYFSAARGTGEAQATKLAAVLTANLQKGRSRGGVIGRLDRGTRGRLVLVDWCP